MPIGTQTRCRKRHRAICPNGATHTSPGCQPWEQHPREWVCSEGTPHRNGRGRYPRHAGYAAFLQNAGLFFRVDSQGLHPGLVCNAPLGHGIGNVVVDWPQRSRADTSERDARWGMDTRSKCHCSICPNGATHTSPRHRPGNRIREK